MHIIPRYRGDVPDPRGGIRRIKKSVAPYPADGEYPDRLIVVQLYYELVEDVGV